MLPDLHAALRRYPGDLPPLGTVALDLSGWLARLDAGPDPVGEAARARLHAAADRLRPLLDPAADDRPLHGDAHPGNLIAGCRGLVWNDLEEVCRGPLEWDLAAVGDVDAVRAVPHDPDRLAACGQLRTLQVVLVLILLRPGFGDLPGWDDGIRAMLAGLED
jgi:Ser/Thr protein kinase RdoA (MazF antagonist)